MSSLWVCRWRKLNQKYTHQWARSPADDNKAALSRPISEWVLWCQTLIGLCSATLVWGVRWALSRNIRHSPGQIRLWSYHYASSFSIFRFTVKNASVNAKWTRTKCIVFFFWSGPNQPSEPNYKCERTLKLQIFLWMNYPCVFYNGVPMQEKS